MDIGGWRNRSPNGDGKGTAREEEAVMGTGPDDRGLRRGERQAAGTERDTGSPGSTAGHLAGERGADCGGPGSTGGGRTQTRNLLTRRTVSGGSLTGAPTGRAPQVRGGRRLEGRWWGGH